MIRDEVDSSKMDEDGKDYTVHTYKKHDPIMKLSLCMVKTTSDGCNFVVIWRSFTVSCDVVSPTSFLLQCQILMVALCQHHQLTTPR